HAHARSCGTGIGAGIGAGIHKAIGQRHAHGRKKGPGAHEKDRRQDSPRCTPSSGSGHGHAQEPGQAGRGSQLN
ncbi:MAG: hypothetical protein KKC85_21995, partial [Gammaproteobacteria bacterium]|nr:hypothetical protein [Gammaproteobacteria bacterium]